MPTKAEMKQTEKGLMTCINKQTKVIEELKQEKIDLIKAQNVLALSVMRAMNNKLSYFDIKIQFCKWIMEQKMDRSEEIYKLIEKAKKLGFEWDSEEWDE